MIHVDTRRGTTHRIPQPTFQEHHTINASNGRAAFPVLARCLGWPTPYVINIDPTPMNVEESCPPWPSPDTPFFEREVYREFAQWVRNTIWGFRGYERLAIRLCAQSGLTLSDITGASGGMVFQVDIQEYVLTVDHTQSMLIQWTLQGRPDLIVSAGLVIRFAIEIKRGPKLTPADTYEAIAQVVGLNLRRRSCSEMLTSPCVLLTTTVETRIIWLDPLDGYTLHVDVWNGSLVAALRRCITLGSIQYDTEEALTSSTRFRLPTLQCIDFRRRKILTPFTHRVYTTTVKPHDASEEDIHPPVETVAD